MVQYVVRDALVFGAGLCPQRVVLVEDALLTACELHGDAGSCCATPAPPTKRNAWPMRRSPLETCALKAELNGTP